FDARRRPWYQLALAQPQDGPAWTDPYEFFDGTTGISAAQAWRRPGNAQPQGVFGVDFSLQDLTEVLNESPHWREDRGVLLNRQGQILASSVPAAGDPEDSIVPAALKTLARPLASIPLDTPVTISVDDAGTGYFGVVQFFQVPGGVEWGYLSLVPAERRVGPIWRNAYLAGGVGLLAMLLAASLGFVLARRVAGPLRRIAPD